MTWLQQLRPNRELGFTVCRCSQSFGQKNAYFRKIHERLNFYHVFELNEGIDHCFVQEIQEFCCFCVVLSKKLENIFYNIGSFNLLKNLSAEVACNCKLTLLKS